MTCQGNIQDQGVVLQVVKNLSSFQVTLRTAMRSITCYLVR
jgi:hypothetical protein